MTNQSEISAQQLKNEKEEKSAQERADDKANPFARENRQVKKEMAMELHLCGLTEEAIRRIVQLNHQ